MQPFIIIHPNDNVAVALETLEAGSTLEIGEEQFFLKESIPRGHKFALRNIEKGEGVVKYGAEIGKASCRIEKGSWVHTHNVKTNLGDILSYTYQPCKRNFPVSMEKHYFQGFRRSDGRAGIRNEIWIIPY